MKKNVLVVIGVLLVGLELFALIFAGGVLSRDATGMEKVLAVGSAILPLIALVSVFNVYRRMDRPVPRV